MLQAMRSSAKYIFLVLFVAFVAWLALDTSGLLGRTPSVTRGTTIATVNGEAITAGEYNDAVSSLTQRAQQQGRSLSLDDQRQLEQTAFDQIVSEILVRQELQKRGITVTDREIQQAAQTTPPPELVQNAEFQTGGQFDPQKYMRWVSSPSAKQQGILYYLENYYRGEIPKAKLAQQIATGVFISDAQLWAIYRDQHDSATISFVGFDPATIADSAVQVSDADIAKYFDAHKDQFSERPGRAVISVMKLPRPITAADSAAVRAHAGELRQEILSGQSTFEQVAERESVDSVSAAQGGSLGRVAKGRFVKPFDDVAFSLPAGQISQPVETQFGVHLIKVDERSGDTIAVRHILLPFRQSDSSAAAVDRRADELARIAESTSEPERFDSAAKAMNLEVGQVVAIEGEPLIWNGGYVPDVGAWAFRNVNPGQTGSLVSSDDAYYLARLDSITPGGKPTLAMMHDDIRTQLAYDRKLALLLPLAGKVSCAVAAGQSLEDAARQAGLTVQHAGPFTRTDAVPGLGRHTTAIGAAFGLPVGAVSEPVESRTGVFVLRVDRRVTADRSAWEAQKDAQRQGTLDQLRQQRVQQFMSNLRQGAAVVDSRKEKLYPNVADQT